MGRIFLALSLQIVLFPGTTAAEEPSLQDYSATLVEVELRVDKDLELDRGDLRSVVGWANAYARSRLDAAGFQVVDPPVNFPNRRPRRGYLAETRLSLEIREAKEGFQYGGRISVRPGLHLLRDGARNRPIIWSLQRKQVVDRPREESSDLHRRSLKQIIDHLLKALLDWKKSPKSEESVSKKTSAVFRADVDPAAELFTQ